MLGKEYYNPRHKSGLMPLLWISILFGLGIILGDSFGSAIGTGMWLVIACGIVFVGLLGVKRWPNISFLMILISVVAFGGIRISIDEDGMEYEEQITGTVQHKNHTNARIDDKNARMEDKNEEICNILVLNEPVEHGKVVHFDAFVYEGGEYIKDGSVMKSGLEGRKVRVSLLRDTVTGKYSDVHIGSFMKAKAEWALLEEWHHTNSHFSYVRWQKSRGFTRRAFIGIGNWELKQEEWSDVGLWLHAQTKMMMFRQRIIDKLQKSGLGNEAYGVASAMVLGDKSSLSRDIRNEYNKAGASHILALSGMHLMIIYMMLTTLFGRMKRRLELVILGMLWVYVMFAGMPISLVRAATMLSVYKVTSMIGVNQHQLNVIGFAALVILVANPQSLWDVGFQMSFMAVLFIVIYAPYFNEMKPNSWKIKKKDMSALGKWRQYRYLTYRKLWNMAGVSVAAQLGTLPLSCYYFERIPCYFLISNFIVIPLAAVIIGVMIVLVVVCLVDMYVVGCGVVIVWGGKVLEYVVWLMNRSQSVISSMPGSSIEGVDVNVVQVVLIYIVMCGGMALVWKFRHGMPEGRWKVPR